MPGTSKAKNKRGIEINFIEDTHKYYSIIDGKELVYTSGTTFVNKFFPVFDPDGKIAKRCADKEGVSIDEIHRKWTEKRERSCVYGTRIHESMEDRLLGRPFRNKPEDDREKLVFETVEKLSDKILKNMDIIGIEKIIFDERLKLAGTIDLFARSKKNGKLWILDHKTNEKIESYNKYGSFGLYPIQHIPNVTKSHYEMQLNLYNYILKYSGYVDKNENIGMCLLHITEKGDEMIVLRDRHREIKDMIDVFKGEIL